MSAAEGIYRRVSVRLWSDKKFRGFVRALQKCLEQGVTSP